MPKALFPPRFQTHVQWRERLARTLEGYAKWLDNQGLANPDSLATIQRGLAMLNVERPTIACVAEAGRGKAALLNALFFADAGRPWLPFSAACPSEIHWDAQRDEPYLRLLPIETLTQGRSLAQLRRDPRQWVQYPLDVQSPERMERLLEELSRSRQVEPADARRLGLRPLPASPREMTEGLIEIPRWRYALISLPHPLLRQGLVLLNLPGLGVLEREPELRPEALPDSSLVLFVLAADQGLTATDRDLWEPLLRDYQARRPERLLVILNQIDLLGDPDQNEAASIQAIARQRGSVAQALGLEEERLFPVSARHALRARARHDRTLLRRSALEDLDAHLAGHVLSSWEQGLLTRVQGEVGGLLEGDLARMDQELEGLRQQARELESLRDKGRDVVLGLLDKTQRDQAQYLHGVSRFQNGRADLQRATLPLREALDPQRLERVIEQARQAMLDSWTTRGIKRVIGQLFATLREIMQAITDHCERIRALLQAIYGDFQTECGLTALPPPPFSSMKYRVSLEFLHQEAEAYRQGRMLAMRERRWVVEHFFQQLVGEAWVIFDDLKKELERWLPQALQPLADAIEAHKEAMEKRLVTLQKIENSRHKLLGRIQALENHQVDKAYQLTALRNLRNGIFLNPSANGLEPTRPRLVAQAPGRRGA